MGGRERPPRPQPKPHAHAPERARGNTPARNAALLRDGRRPPARRNPPPTRRGEARATVGARATSCVVARPLKVGARERGPSARTQKAATERASRGGAAAGGSGTPRHPLGSLEKGFLTEGASSPRQRKHPIGPAKPHFRATLGAGGGRSGEDPTWTESSTGYTQDTSARDRGRRERREEASPCCLEARPLDSPGASSTVN